MTNFSLAAMPESSKAKHPELYNAPKFKAICCKCGKVDMLDHAHVDESERIEQVYRDIADQTGWKP